ncbi:MAG: hypothetical protein H6581_11870 [Bacteroidia bacterium]|nr:hypothetical protein [Bacteroidia bacterium]
MLSQVKRFICMAFPALLILFTSCEPDPIIKDTTVKPITFQVPDSCVMTVPPAISLNLPFDLPIIPVNTSVNQSIDNLNPLIDLVRDIYLNEMVMTITTPGEKFDFLKHIALYARATGEPDLLMAKYDNVPSNIGNTLTLTPVPNKLDNYLKSDFSLRVEVTVDKVFFNPIEVKSNMLMDVTLINF